jgi:hypothetical protein
MVAVMAWNRATDFDRPSRHRRAIDRIAAIQDKMDSISSTTAPACARYSPRGIPALRRRTPSSGGFGVRRRGSKARSQRGADGPGSARRQTLNRGRPRAMELANSGRDLNTFDRRSADERGRQLCAIGSTCRRGRLPRLRHGSRRLVPRTEDDKDISTRAADAW